MATAIARQKESDTKHTAGSREKRVCTSLPAQECLISALHSRATPTAPFQVVLGEYLPAHKTGTAGLSSSCRLSDLYVRW